jgi:hypothetical protein
MLVNASGCNATITLRESNGRYVSCVDYHGQSQVVFNGKAESVTYPSNRTTYVGTDQMIQDWRNGTWTPSDGALVVHPSNVTLTEARFYLMTLEPNGQTDIPEYELMPAIGGAVLVILLMRREKQKDN